MRPDSRFPVHARGFTAVELLVVVLAIVLLVGFLLPAIGRRSHTSRPLKDSTQVRGAIQAMIVWASNNKEQYPLPSQLDLQNLTVAEPGEAKDTTASILSLLIFNGNISPDLLISPAESNTSQVRLDTDYQYERPAAAMDPANALWDSAFRGTPIDRPTLAKATGIGNNSYAHAIPIGERLKTQWRDSFSSTQAVFGNRGPTYAADDRAANAARWSLPPGPTGTGSNTLLIHGGRTTWEGNIGYNDGRVVFETKPNPDSITYPLTGPTGPGGARVAPDNLFVNETDEATPDAPGSFDTALNMYLRPIADRSIGVNVWRD